MSTILLFLTNIIIFFDKYTCQKEKEVLQ